MTHHHKLLSGHNWKPIKINYLFKKVKNKMLRSINRAFPITFNQAQVIHLIKSAIFRKYCKHSILSDIYPGILVVIRASGN
jgi:hypothetical protein